MPPKTAAKKAKGKGLKAPPPRPKKVVPQGDEPFNILKPSTWKTSCFKSNLDTYRSVFIKSYFMHTTMGRQLSKKRMENLKGLKNFARVENWVEPGFFCSDFKTVDDELISTRWIVEVPRDAEHVHELVEEHGIVCVHTAIPSVPTDASNVADLWLVSMQDKNGKTIWPMTWIYHDDFDGLARHATSAESENWRNVNPWELNILPEHVVEAQPLVKVTGTLRTKDNVPFSYYLECKILDQEAGYVEKQLSSPDISEFLTYCHFKSQRSTSLFCSGIKWKDLTVTFSVVEQPHLVQHSNPYFWIFQSNKLIDKTPPKQASTLPLEFQEKEDAAENERREIYWRNAVYNQQYDVSKADIAQLEKETNSLIRSYNRGEVGSLFE